MTDIFRTVLNMSITGAYISAAIIILRIAMKKLPKKYSYLLWAILGIRLLCPFSFSSAVSVFNVLVPEKPEVSYGQMEFIPNDIEYSEEPQIIVSVPPVNEKINEQLPPAQPNNSANPMQISMAVGAYIWAAGTLAMLVYTAVSYISVKKKVKSAKLSDGNVYTCASIETPFVFGIIKPRIFLPENISDEDMRYIIAHEQAHISRKDHIVKLVAMAALCVHWFNPMVWISYRLMTKDMELSCDEKALGGFDTDVKKAYANALLNISLKQNKLALGGVLNFGESDIKSRIKGVLGAKKPKVIVTVVAVIAVIIAAVCLLTNAVKKTTEFAPIPDGVYVTDKLLYTAPQKDSYLGDDNGLTYEIKGDTITISGKTYKLSEPMEIPFTEEEWSDSFDNFEKIGWQDGEKNLGDYDNKYCFALQSDEDGGFELYLFIMDDELWYVTYGLEIYRLKQIDTSPMDAARKYLNGKNITDENISELTVAQNSFYNEAWKYTLLPLSLKYDVNDGDNVIEVTAVYSIDGKDVRTLIITCANEEGFRVLDEVNYLPREFTAAISEVYGNEQLTGYEWQKYVIIPDEDSYGFTKGEKALVFSRPYYGNDFFNVGDKVKVQYSGEPVTSFTFVGFEQPAYYFLRLTSLQDGQPTEDIPEDVSDDDVTDEPAYSLPANEAPTLQTSDEFDSEVFGEFKKISHKRQVMYPDEYGGYNIIADAELVDVQFVIPKDWAADGQGLFMLGEEKVLEQNVVYPDSYGLMTEGFLVDMVSGREIKKLDEKYGGENDPYSYYIHTSMQSYDGVYDTHYFVIQQNGYYVTFCFNDSEDFSMAAAEAILSTVTVSPVSSNREEKTWTKQDITDMFYRMENSDKLKLIDCVLISDRAFDRIGAVLFEDIVKGAVEVAFLDEDGFAQPCSWYFHTKAADPPDLTYLGNGTISFKLETEEHTISTYTFTFNADWSDVGFVSVNDSKERGFTPIIYEDITNSKWFNKCTEFIGIYNETVYGLQDSSTALDMISDDEMRVFTMLEIMNSNAKENPNSISFRITYTDFQLNDTTNNIEGTLLYNLVLSYNDDTSTTENKSMYFVISNDGNDYSIERVYDTTEKSAEEKESEFEDFVRNRGVLIHS